MFKCEWQPEWEKEWTTYTECLIYIADKSDNIDVYWFFLSSVESCKHTQRTERMKHDKRLQIERLDKQRKKKSPIHDMCTFFFVLSTAYLLNTPQTHIQANTNNNYEFIEFIVCQPPYLLVPYFYCCWIIKTSCFRYISSIGIKID